MVSHSTAQPDFIVDHAVYMIPSTWRDALSAVIGAFGQRDMTTGVQDLERWALVVLPTVFNGVKCFTADDSTAAARLVVFPATAFHISHSILLFHATNYIASVEVV